MKTEAKGFPTAGAPDELRVARQHMAPKTVPVTLRAAAARFDRHLAKQGQRLRMPKTPIDSIYQFVIVDADSVVAMADFDGFVAWLREGGILKAYEIVVN